MTDGRTTLFNILARVGEDEEICVWDTEYGDEMYFWGVRGKTEFDDWGTNILKLAKTLRVVAYRHGRYFVNFSEIIRNKINDLQAEDLFKSYSIPLIMQDMPSIISGYVSDKYFARLVNVLTKE